MIFSLFSSEKFILLELQAHILLIDSSLSRIYTARIVIRYFRALLQFFSAENDGINWWHVYDQLFAVSNM